MFQTLICSVELNKDQEISRKLQDWGNSGLQLVLLPCSGEKSQQKERKKLLDAIEANQALWIVLSDEEWEMGMEYHIACLPYVPLLERIDELEEGKEHEVFSSFPKAEHIFTSFEGIDIDYLERIYRRAHHLPWIIAETERFILRELTMADMDGLFELYEDETLYPFVEPLYERKKEEEYEIQYISNIYHLLGYGMWLVVEPATGRIIGRAGIEPKEYEGTRGIEIGYVIHRDYRGKGLAKEVCETIIDYAKSMLGYEVINCVVHENNLPSIRLAQKLGFVRSENQSGVKSGMVRYILTL